MENITELFKNTGSKLIKGIIDSGGVVLATQIEGFAYVLVEDKEYSDVLGKKVEDETGVKGFISTDELPKYGISKEEKQSIEARFKVGPRDVVILVADQEAKAKKAIEVIEAEVAKRKLFKASGPFLE